MSNTKLLYLEHMDQLEETAVIQDVLEENSKQIVVLNQTIFYPQGGGQPYDQGGITSLNSRFKVEEVRFLDGIVKHIGVFEHGMFQKNDEVKLRVDRERRLLNSRLHSAGHLVDMAIYELMPDWIPQKGYHFPDGPYVEYTGTLEESEKEHLVKSLEVLMNKKISEIIPVSILFTKHDELSKYCRHVPENIPEGKPIRIVLFGDFGVPCGGTHIQNLSILREVTVRKIKGSSGIIKVSYDVER